VVSRRAEVADQARAVAAAWSPPDAPASWLADNRRGGGFGVIGRVSLCGGRRAGTLLGRAHPGSAWLEWTAPVS
jgi:hypothetical protein